MCVVSVGPYTTIGDEDKGMKASIGRKRKTKKTRESENMEGINKMICRKILQK